jgi:hypothetical protein
MPRPAKNLFSLVVYVGISLALRDGLGWDSWLSWFIGLIAGAFVFALLQERGFYSRSWRE